MSVVAIASISVLLFASSYIMKCYTASLTKLSRSNLFCLCFIEKDIVMGANGREFEGSDW